MEVVSVPLGAGKGLSPKPSLESAKYLPKFCFNSFVVAFIDKFFINLGICRGGGGVWLHHTACRIAVNPWSGIEHGGQQ